MSELPNTTPALLYPEKKLADAIDLPADKLRALRKVDLKLKTPEHFELLGREIYYTPAGVGRLLEFVRASGLGEIPRELDEFVEQPPEPDVTDTEKEGPESELLTITRVYPNRHLLQAKKESGDLVRVWVRDNRKFVPTMELLAEHWEGKGPDFYRSLGRGPRRKGRW